MRIITAPKTIQHICFKLKQKKQTVGFVPTMGCLHEGHLSLVRLAKKKTHKVIVSLFVNPTQFGPHEDFSRYPRPLKNDLALLKKAGVDFVFCPEVKSLYPKNFQTTVQITQVTQPLCGQSRPTHFQGVCTVVLKLFNLIMPTIAVFGKKDYQQLITIKTMVRDLHLPIKIIAAPIVREPDGLAMSSRNLYLSPAERMAALSLSQGLKKVKIACLKKNQGVKAISVNRIKTIFKTSLAPFEEVKLDYMECLKADDLSPLDSYQRNKTLVAVAAYVGKTRLIDNVVI